MRKSLQSPVVPSAVVRCLVLATCVLPASAQLYAGSIAGTVTDPSTTDNGGRYLLRNIPRGCYNVAAEAPNFERQRKDGIVVAVSQNVSVDFSLKIGTTSQTVEVQAQHVQLQTQDAAMSQSVDRRLINDLPLITRQFSDLAFLTPGITEVDTQCPPSQCGAGNFISNGSRNSTADFLLDGVTATNFDQNSGILSATYLPSVDSVEEFKVQTSNFSAEYGFAGATIINIVTRAGTNQFHGSQDCATISLQTFSVRPRGPISGVQN